MSRSVDAPRSRDELERALDLLGIQDGVYHLHGAHLDDAYVIDHRSSGWVVFYSQRGHEDILDTYETEAEACADLFERVTAEEHAYFTLIAGPSLPAEADEEFAGWLAERHMDRSELRPEDWKYDDVPWATNSPDFRRYFIRITTVRELSASDHIRIRRITPSGWLRPNRPRYEIEYPADQGGQHEREHTNTPASGRLYRTIGRDAWTLIDAADEAWDGERGEWVRRVAT